MIINVTIEKAMCRLGWCGMVQKCDDTHLWGECQRCGRKAGIVSRASIRRYIEAEARNKKLQEEQEMPRKSIVAQAKSGSVIGLDR